MPRLEERWVYTADDNEQLLEDIYNLLTDLQEDLKDFKEKEIL